LYETKSSHEFLSIFLGNPARSNYELVKEFWVGQHKSDDFESFWELSLQEGVIQNPSLVPKTVTDRVKPILATTVPSEEPASGPENLDIVFRPDASVYDGAFAGNGWLQELQHPLTHLTWDNAVLIGPKTAKALKTSSEDKVDLIVNGRQITGAVWIVPGQPENVVTVQLGWGRKLAGRNGTERGFSAYALRTSANPWHATGGRIRKHSEKYELVSTRDHHLTENRHMVRHMTAEDYVKDPDLIHRETHVPKPDQTMYPAYQNIDYAWGMSVDLSRCVGC